MEVVGGIASVAGTVAILGLIGQSVDGILKLKKLVSLIRDADRAVEIFVTDLDSLSGTLASIRELIEKIPDEWLIGEDAISVDVLASQVEKCRDDIKVWEKDAAKLNTKSSRSIDTFFKKLRVASEGCSFNEFHRKVASHQQGIQISLDILGRYMLSSEIWHHTEIRIRSFDILCSRRSQVTNANVIELMQGQGALDLTVSRARDSISEQLEDMSNKLDWVDARSRGSNASMSTLASQLSYLIDMVSASSGGSLKGVSVEKVQQASPSNVHVGTGRLEWSCDTLPGIENSFDESSTDQAICKYCEEPFDTRSTDWYVRGKHLADAHHFGQCNLLLSYPTSDHFKEHLFEFHRMSGHKWPELIDEHKRPTTIYHFHRGEESKSQRTMQIDEAAETEGIYHARMTTILHHTEDALSNARISKAPIPGLTQLQWHLEREIACLQEEFIVGGYTFEALKYPVGLFISNLDADSKSRTISASNTTPEYQFEAPKFKDKASKRSCINLWLYEILRSSNTTKLVLRDISKAAGPDDLGTEAWIQGVLKYWTQDEAATGPDQIYVPSDGAVDSRDSLEIQWVLLSTAGILLFSQVCRARAIPKRPRRARAFRRRRPSITRGPSYEETLPADNPAPWGVIGVCALDIKARSKPSRNILHRLISTREFEVVVFGDKVILDEDVENWPLCDFLISFYSDGFPLDKAIAYVKTRKPFCVNDLIMQKILWDRRICLRILDQINVLTPKRLEVNRDEERRVLTQDLAHHLKETTGVIVDGLEDSTRGQMTPPQKVELLDDGDTLSVDGALLTKPFVEKPVNSEDHNICVYYPKSQGGGARKLFRKIGNKSSEWVVDLTTPRAISEPRSSYIYEKFVRADNAEDVKVYTVGPNFSHAETRKSPVAGGLVRRNTRGKEIRYITSLSKEEALTASRIAMSFGQRVCGFDLLRAEGKSYVISVNGWKFAQENDEYYNQCSRILREMFIRERQRQLGIPLPISTAPSSGTPDATVSPMNRSETGLNDIHCSALKSILSQSASMSKPHGNYGKTQVMAYASSPAPKHKWKLKGMVSVIRHADRTPKQTCKFTFRSRHFIELLKGHQEVLLIGEAALRSLIVAVDIAMNEGVEDRQKLKALKNVLAEKGGWAGTNVQIKPILKKRKSGELLPTDIHDPLDISKGTNVCETASPEAQPDEHPDDPAMSRPLNRNDVLLGITPSRVTAVDNGLVNTVQLIIKWGGEPTHSARYQSLDLGENMRNDLLLMNKEVLDEVHVFSSSERRVTTSAQVWASAFTSQKDLPPDFVNIRKDLLDDSNAANNEMDKVRKKLKTLLQQCNEVPPQRSWPANMPELSSVQEHIIQLMKFHRKVMQQNYSKLHSSTTSFLNAADNPGDKEKAEWSFTGPGISRAVPISGIQARWCCGETAELFKERWEKLFIEFCDDEKVDPSKIYELYDTMKFDALHNHQFLEWVFTPSESLFEERQAIVKESSGLDSTKDRVADRYEGQVDLQTLLMEKAQTSKSAHRQMLRHKSFTPEDRSTDEAPEQVSLASRQVE